VTKPAKYRQKTTKDYIREIYNQNDARVAYQFEKAHGTNAERLLRSIGITERLADTMTAREEQVFIASFAGLKAGRTALTIPELTVIVWLMKAHYSFGGVWPRITDQGADFFSQYPVEGGRTRAGGAVVDVYISPMASKTVKGIAMSIDGVYYHSKTAVAGRDAPRTYLLTAQGYKVARIKDTEVLQKGPLDTFMMNLVGKKQ
jgi:hypothetical protein